MSFTQDVKLELESIVSSSKHCKCAELAGLMGFMTRVSEDKSQIIIPCEDLPQVRKYFTLLNKTYNIETEFFSKQLSQDLKELVLERPYFPVNGILKEIDYENPLKHLKKQCCQRAYLRGVFLAAGFVSDPRKGYHIEINTENDEKTGLILAILKGFGIEAKVSHRRSQMIVYIKESDKVSDMLSLMEAHFALMGFVNEKIVRTIRNRENRINNCDTANIIKTANAANRQIEDILFIEKTVGIDSLNEQLRDIAKIRMEYPEESLNNLGNYLEPPVGKSGVNHRLRKLSEIADDLRKKGNEKNDEKGSSN